MGAGRGSTGRRRRRAVGPSSSATPVEPEFEAAGLGPGLADWPGSGWADPQEVLPADDDDERLRRDVPPHHGS